MNELQPDVTYADYIANARAQMEHDRAAFTGEQPLPPAIEWQRVQAGLRLALRQAALAQPWPIPQEWFAP